MEEEYKRANDFFKNSEPVTISEDVRKELAEERRKQIIDTYRLRMQEDWSFLNSQVVGAESPR